ncbi:hypothetical protein BaRGS_00020833 [Batillaria attramentaria]|uniref:2-methoxy-6-polyprenyl-1,4-benzoquinol methylase, mitochondrial n=1 Tax=Batillaria attramentaria TaxID=370345 RepID=A0ABD0KM11_9CAEN
MAAPLAGRSLLHLSVRLRVCSVCAKYFSTSKSVGHEHDSATQGKTHFGFQSVPKEEKEHKVYEVFENVASRYDLMNDVMSGGVHRLWKDHFMRQLSPMPGTKLIDVAGGTGDIAFRFLQYVGSQPSSHPQLQSQGGDEFDIKMPREVEAQAMLDVGKQKAREQGITSGMSWVQGNAENLPFPDCSFDAYTIAFGIRNCTDVQRVVDEAYRVLKRGGRFMCLEFSQVTNPVLRSVYDSYSFQVIPVMGQVIAKDWKSYQYLVESIRQFPDQEEFADMIRSSGFRMVTYENLTFGVAAIHSGFKLH